MPRIKSSQYFFFVPNEIKGTKLIRKNINTCIGVILPREKHNTWQYALNPSNALHSGQEFFLSNLVDIGHYLAIWPLVDPGLPQRDFWPQQCITLWSGVLPTKFGSHKAFLRQFDLWMTFDLGVASKICSKTLGPISYLHAKF